MLDTTNYETHVWLDARHYDLTYLCLYWWGRLRLPSEPPYPGFVGSDGVVPYTQRKECKQSNKILVEDVLDEIFDIIAKFTTVKFVMNEL